MNEKIKKVLEIWHKHFDKEENQYSEYESSDIEYFVGCMIYNHLSFSKALSTLKTMDLSYDFLSSCSGEYDEIKEIIESISFEDELSALEFLQNYIDESRAKYNVDELYLLNRLHKHIDDMAKRYRGELEEQDIDFAKVGTTYVNPLLR